MARYDDVPVPRGTSSRWEVILAEEEGAEGQAPERTALDVRGEHRVLHGLDEAELARIPLLGPGERLARYGAYIDLHDPGRCDFVAEGTEVVRPGQRLVSRTAVSRDAWERLRAACAEVVGHRQRKSA